MRIDDPVPGNAMPVGTHASSKEAAIPTLVLVRRLDGLTYRFDREPAQWNGRASYRRVDLPLWIRRSDTDGWAVVDAEGTANGWPMSGAMDPVLPPLVRWRSQKADKSYLYDLYDLRDPGHPAVGTGDPGEGGSALEVPAP